MSIGDPAPEVAEAYAVLFEAQAAAVKAATVGTPCEDGRRAPPETSSRRPGFGENFIHRTGHGIGVEEHEDPYIVKGNAAPLEHGHAFSIEPGIYLAGRFGLRLEDIVVATAAGPDAHEPGRPSAGRRRRLSRSVERRRDRPRVSNDVSSMCTAAVSSSATRPLPVTQ